MPVDGAPPTGGGSLQENHAGAPRPADELYGGRAPRASWVPAGLVG